jgi:hypothetical protein
LVSRFKTKINPLQFCFDFDDKHKQILRSLLCNNIFFFTQTFSKNIKKFNAFQESFTKNMISFALLSQICKLKKDGKILTCFSSNEKKHV